MVDTEELLSKELERASKAERLLKDPMFNEAFQVCEDHILQMFRSAPLRDEEGIVKAKYLLHLLSLVKGAVTQVVRTGQLAEKQLEERRRGVTWLGDVWKSRQSRR
jgi:hypothetical protein